jgi:hypothetical protein
MIAYCRACENGNRGSDGSTELAGPPMSNGDDCATPRSSNNCIAFLCGDGLVIGAAGSASRPSPAHDMEARPDHGNPAPQYKAIRLTCTCFAGPSGAPMGTKH